MPASRAALLIGLLVAVLLGAAAGSPSALCAVAVSMSPSELTAQINATTPDAVTFSGNVTVDKPEAARLVVTLTATVSTGWPVAVAPESMTFVGGSRTQVFSATVVVPQATPAREEGILTVEATGSAAGLTCPPATASAKVLVGLYHGPITLRVEPREAEVRGDPPEAAFTATISEPTNGGESVSETFTVEPPPGATASDAPVSVRLDPAANMTVQGSVRFHVATAGLAPGEYPVLVRVGSGGTAGNATAQVTVRIPAGTVPFSPFPGSPGAAIVLAALVAGLRCRRARNA